MHYVNKAVSSFSILFIKKLSYGADKALILVVREIIIELKEMAEAIQEK